jgi:hypothetical protein
MNPINPSDKAPSLPNGYPALLASDTSPSWNNFRSQNDAMASYLASFCRTTTIRDNATLTFAKAQPLPVSNSSATTSTTVTKSAHASSLEVSERPHAIPAHPEPPDNRPQSSKFSAPHQTARPLPIVMPATDVRAGRIGRFCDLLINLSENQADSTLYQGRMEFQIAGFGADPRSIAQIPECVNFVRQVHTQWPFWLHFMANTEYNLAIVSLLMAFRSHKNAPNGRDVMVEIAKTSDTRHTVRTLLQASTVLRAFHGLQANEDAYLHTRLQSLLDNDL